MYMCIYMFFLRILIYLFIYFQLEAFFFLFCDIKGSFVTMTFSSKILN